MMIKPMCDKPKIMIVDDDDVQIKIFEKFIGELDVECISANSGFEALKKAKENDLAIAVIDVSMPKMDGYETVMKMREDGKNKHLPIIFYSAVYSETYYAQKGLETGAVDFIQKPINPKILHEKIKVFLNIYEQKQKRIELINQLEKANKKLNDEIEQRKVIEVKLRDAKEKAEESERLKTAFLSNMSHEIRTPMNAIIGFSDLLVKGGLSKNQQNEFVEIINTNTYSLLHLINDIIDISKIESGLLIIKKTECKLNKILEQLRIYFEKELERSNKNHIKIFVDKARDEDFIFRTDPIRLKQVLNNLIGNAVKFTDNGSISFGYKIIDNKVEFFVKDTGIGIKSEQMEIVFQRFMQIENNSTKLYGGTGLGLAISKNLVELLGGKMWVESEENKETNFHFTIPLEGVTETTEIENEKEVDVSNYNWKDKKILIVEDVESNFWFVREALRKTHVNIKWAKDGDEAIDICKNDDEIDLVLMDIQLPIVDGYHATRVIKKHRKDLKIIAQTAYAMPGEREKSLQAGCDEYLGKPIRVKDLLKMVNKFIDN